jgi:epoxide hydrolase-like predicted phosphatase
LGLEPLEFEQFVFSGKSGRQAQLGQKTSAAHWLWLGDYFELNEAELAEMQHDFFAGDALNEALVEHIKRLRRAGYRTGLLSNFMDDARTIWTEIYPFIQHFDGIILSSEVGLLKPDPQIYYLAAESIGVDVTEALFVDDFSENVKGAKAVGMQTIHYIDPEAAWRELTAITGVK